MYSHTLSCIDGSVTSNVEWDIDLHVLWYMHIHVYTTILKGGEAFPQMAHSILQYSRKPLARFLIR